MPSTDIDGSPIVILRQEVWDEYQLVHKNDWKEIADLEKKNFELRCDLADARGDIDTLKKERDDLREELKDTNSFYRDHLHRG